MIAFGLYDVSRPAPGSMAIIARQSRIDDSDYGLGIWHRWYNVQTPAGDRCVDTIMLSGNGGQKVFLVPSLDLIVVSTGVNFFVDSPLNEILARVLLPALMTSGQNSSKLFSAFSSSVEQVTLSRKGAGQRFMLPGIC